MSFCPPRPIVSWAESSTKSWPSSRSGLLTTTSRPVTGPRRAVLRQLGGPARDIHVGERDVAVPWPPDHHAPLLHLVTAPVPAEGDELRLDAELLRRHGLRRLGCRLRLVDHRGARLDVGR